MCTCGFDLCKTSIMVCIRARIGAGQRSTTEVHAHAERRLPQYKGNPGHPERTSELLKSDAVVPVRGDRLGLRRDDCARPKRACWLWIAQAEIAWDSRWSLVPAATVYLPGDINFSTASISVPPLSL